MLRLELSARPSVALFKFNAEQIFCFVDSAIFHAGLTGIRLELKRDDSIHRNGVFDFKTCARWGNIFKNGPLGLSVARFRIPLNFNEIGAKLSIFSSIECHDLSIGKSKRWFSLDSPRAGPKRGIKCDGNRIDALFTCRSGPEICPHRNLPRFVVVRTALQSRPIES